MVKLTGTSQDKWTALAFRRWHVHGPESRHTGPPRVPIAACLALAVQANPVAGVDTRRHRHGQGLLLAHPALAETRVTGIADDLAAPLAAGAGLLDRENGLLDPNLALPVAGSRRFSASSPWPPRFPCRSCTPRGRESGSRSRCRRPLVRGRCRVHSADRHRENTWIAPRCPPEKISPNISPKMSPNASPAVKPPPRPPSRPACPN